MQPQGLILKPRHRRETGAALIAAIIIIGIIAAIAGSVLMTAVPAYRSTYHASAWHEAKLAADAGIDLGMAAIQRSLPDPNEYTWPGWTLPDGTTPVPKKENGVRVLTPSPDLLVHAGDGSTRPTIVRVEVDIITRDDNVSRNPWFRIRATGAADIASPQLGLDKRDAFLRRISTQNQRVTRTVEVLARPVYLWEYALKTAGKITLGGGDSWVIDSYDSRYATKTEPDDPNNHRGSSNGNGPNPDGDYRGMYDPAKAGEFGSIASNWSRPANSPYGVLIDAEGALVRGEVETRGGDNPDTPQFENVEEYDRIDPSRISSDFEETLLPPEDPRRPATTEEAQKNVVRITDPTPWINGNFKTPATTPTVFSNEPGSPGLSASDPLRIMYTTNGGKAQNGFSVPTSPDNVPRFVEVYIDANLTVPQTGGGLVIPPNVHAKVFVNGNIDFSNRDLNYSSTSSRVPGNLQIYGVSASPSARVDSSGNGHIVGVFYGPQYAGNLDGNTEIVGGFVLKTYNIAGGGGNGGDSVGAGFHYDEALGVVGPIQEYKAVSYFEDSRKDVE